MPVDSSASEPRERADDGIPARFGRVADLYGLAGLARLRLARVAVIGLGGVGAHAAVCLARSGLGQLLLVDFDLVTASSLNRSPVAGPADVGRAKVDVLAEHLARACPETAVETRRDFCHAESLAALLQPGTSAAPDLVLDAIDSRNPKVTLLAYCLENALPVISSMGAAGRRDPAALRTGDLAQTRVCPLARHVRRYLKRRGALGPVPCVWSEEDPATPCEPDSGDRTLDRGRVRNRLPSQMALPGIFGYALAALALERLTAPLPGEDPDGDRAERKAAAPGTGHPASRP
ncbi:MAG: tRNA threonylcarbamoyladenosine dehydratase [Candidatus Krumholzibacteriia bacterium]